jgi:BirA family biotin operon repressor/biotin-[acetyl-CoA-carboxylase] ligase
VKKIYLKEVKSTQLYLIEGIKKGIFSSNICVYTDFQTDGIGTRGNKWIGKRGNLFFSFALKNSFDVPIESLSIYFGYVFKKSLNNLGSKVVLKWPNDLYLEKKVGGVITNILDNMLVCGIGLNTKFAPDGFSYLDINVKNDKILDNFFDLLKEKPKWKDVFKEYKKEFFLTKKRFNINGELLEDGSLKIDNKRIFSRR